ncbi:MAG: thioredoxin family protein [Pirellulaceae bacterium]
MMNSVPFRRHRVLIPLFLLVISVGVGCNSKPKAPKLPSIFEFLVPSAPTYKPADWTEHTVDLPFVYGYSAGIAEAQLQNKPAMIFMTATWCKWCKRMAESSLRDPEVRQVLQRNFVLVLVDGDQEASVKRKLKNTSYPHIVFVSPNEKILASQNGSAEANAFKQVIATALEADASRAAQAADDSVAAVPSS